MTKMGSWQRIRHERLSRRRLMAAAGASASGLAVAAACGGGGDGEETPVAGQTPTAAAGTPEYGGRYQASTPVDWGTLDPARSVGAFPEIAARLYNSLLDRSRIDPDFWFFDLAENVEQPDEESYVFNLRPGVKIAPNDLGIEEREMDSSDAKVWQDRIVEDEDAGPRTFTVQWVESYEAPDAWTFKMKTKGPYAYFFFRVGPPGGGSIPPREFWEQGIDLSDKGVGGGPYVIRPGSYEETGGIVLDRNRNYYRTDPNNNDARLPYCDGIDVYRITDRLALRSAFIDEQIYVYGAEDMREKDELVGQNPDYFVTEEPVNTFISFTMNPTRPPWDDEKVRKAALYALDRQEFADRIFGEGGAKPDGLVHWPAGPFALDPEELEQLQPHDPERSRQLIREATGEDTIKIKVIYPIGVNIFYHDKHLPIFLQQMEAAGFDIEEDARDFGTWLGKYADVDYDASLSLNQVYELPDGALNWHHSLGPATNGKYGIGIGKLYPEIDEAILKSRETADLEEAAERVREAQRLCYEKGPASLPIVSWVQYSLHQPFVENIRTGLGRAGTYLNDMWLDL